MLYYSEKIKKILCSVDPDHEIIGPPYNDIKGCYCRTCVQIQYEKASRCPICGIKDGFAPGTGDCGCEVDNY